jgi:hypothetical protein
MNSVHIVTCLTTDVIFRSGAAAISRPTLGRTKPAIQLVSAPRSLKTL